MLTFLYDLPNWGMGAVISVFFIAVTLLSYYLFRHFVKAVVQEANGIAQRARDLAVFDSGESREARDRLRESAAAR